MEPDVRYCTTADGVRIAYTVTGSGPPHLFNQDAVVSHVQLEWSQPFLGGIFRELARHNTLIRFDARGCGLSDRTPQGSIDEAVLDYEAVVDRLGLREFGQSAIQSSAQGAMAFAARHPEQVRRLVLVNGYARNADLMDTGQVEALLRTFETDWEMATEVVGLMAFGPGRAESLPYGAFVRSCVGPEFFSNAMKTRDWDVSEAAASLRMPVLLVHHTGIRFVTDAMTRDLASRIPDARLATLEGMWADDPEGFARRIAAFINEGLEATAAPPQREQSGVRTVLFTDLVGHTEMMRRLGDTRGRDVLREHERIAQEAIARHRGTVIKTDGDSFMVSFGSVATAMECAVAMQRAYAARNESADEPLRVRMGLNAGEPIEEAGDLFGEAVILAARIADQASEGEILIAEPVRHLLAGKGFVFADRGAFVPKGFEDTVRLFEVRWRA